MQFENLAYALTQVVHNFGALAVVGGALVALKVNPDQQKLRNTMAWIVLVGWAAQGVSGLLFGGISFLFYGETPDLHSTAMYALVLKAVCAVSGIILALFYLRSAKDWGENSRQSIWRLLTGLGVTALTAAAFLRWFS